MTVSFVLNNRPGQVSEETRERVLRTVREMGYRPRLAHRRPAERVIHTIGIALGRTGVRLSQIGYHREIANAISLAAEDNELNVLLFHGGLFHEDPRQGVRTYLDGRCDGLIVIAPLPDMPLVGALKERGIPSVLIGMQWGGGGIASVDIDNIAESERIVDYLVGLGHRKIAFIGGPEFVQSACLRRDGFHRAMERHGLAVNPAWDIAPIFRDYEVYERTVALMAVPKKQRPTAVYGWNDGVVMRAMHVMTDMSVRIREEVSLIGIDDIPQATVATPAITTMRQPYREIGAKAVEVLLERIRDPNAPARNYFLPCRLIERDSTAPPTK